MLKSFQLAVANGAINYNLPAKAETIHGVAIDPVDLAGTALTANTVTRFGYNKTSTFNFAAFGNTVGQYQSIFFTQPIKIEDGTIQINCAGDPAGPGTMATIWYSEHNI